MEIRVGYTGKVLRTGPIVKTTETNVVGVRFLPAVPQDRTSSTDECFRNPCSQPPSDQASR